MENLSLHIEYLLLRHDCVVVPGIGAFINIYQAPEFDKATGKITPMMREVRFNGAVRSDDGLLANSYARKYQISYREGAELLRQDIEMLRESILTDGETTLGHIGTLRMEEGGALRFIPMRTAEQMARDLGFITVPFKPKSITFKDNKPQKEQKEDLVSVHEVKEKPEESNTAAKIRNLDFERNYYIPVNKKGLRVAACLLGVIFIILASIHLPQSDADKRIERASVVPTEKIIDTARQVIRTDKEKPVPAVAVNHKDTIPAVTDSDRYYLIVGTFVTSEEAESYKENNSRDGYELTVVPSRKMYRVSAKVSLDKQELLDELNSDRFRNAYSEAWIWKKEPLEGRK